MSETHLLLALVGTAVCCFGFFRRPKSSYELLQPRFVIPAMIWSAMFSQVFLYYFVEQEFDLYSSARELAGITSLLFLISSLLLFWVGYVLPLGARIAAPLARVESTLPINPARLRPLGAFVCIVVFTTLVVTGGPRFLGFSDASFAGSTMTAVMGPMLSMMSMLGAALVGLSWPARETRNGIDVFVGVFLIFLCCTMGMSNFSRGTGLPIIAAYAAYAIRHQKLPIKTGLFCLYLVAALGYAGMSGRGIFGHYAGVAPFLWQFVTVGTWDIPHAFETVMNANDSFTPLCVSVRGAQTTYLGQLTPLDWMLFQIPFPRVLGLHPEWTFTLTYFVGGRGSWNYTSSMFGDAYAHLGFAGCIVFFFVGIAYRFIAQLVPPLRPAGVQWSVSPYLILVFTSYFACAMGLFNSFRAWNVSFFYPIYLVVGSVMLLWFFRSGNSISQESERSSEMSHGDYRRLEYYDDQHRSY